MGEHQLLIRHAQEWASSRSRPLDADLLGEALDLRFHHDDLPAQEWPTGTAERLLLVTWPAYGSSPRPEQIRDTLDTFWRFLRATGRMSSASAAPADLRKECKRAASRMQSAYDDPARHSQHRVLSDVGQSIGIDLGGASDIDELNDRLSAITQEWNSLPQEERVRRMPGPGPQGEEGAELAEQFRQMTSPAPSPPSPEDLAAAAQHAQEAPFFRDCLRLVEWLGTGRPATQAGLLRPAVAREAYQFLDLWPWDRGLETLRYAQWRSPEVNTPEADAARADLALTWWRTAGDCYALDRLWCPLTVAGAVRLTTTTARPSLPPLDSETDRVGLALALVIGLALRAGPVITSALGLVLDHGVEGKASVSAMRTQWLALLPQMPADLVDLMEGHRRGLFDETLYVFDDTGLWQVHGDDLALTQLGRIFCGIYDGAVRDGILELE